MKPTLLKTMSFALSMLFVLMMCIGCSIQGPSGPQGPAGADGKNGANGTNGKSAYELAVDNGYTGTLDEWLASLSQPNGDKGADGITPQLKIGEDNYWYVSYNNGATWESLNVKATGDKGEVGEAGRGISKAEIIDGCLWITYTDSPNAPVNIGSINPETETTVHEFLILDILPDNTYIITGLKDRTLTNITIPSKINGTFITKIASNAFENNTLIQSVTIPDSITEIGQSSFKNCTNLKEVIIGPDSSLISIDAYAFSECSSLEHIYIPKDTVYIGAYAFYNSGLTTAFFENPEAWNIAGSYSGYPAYFNPVGLSESAAMLKGTFSYGGKTYSFFKQNWLNNHAYIGTSGYYYINIGNRE